MKLVSWNVNGLRACMNKGFLDFFRSADADIFCVQETKMQPDQAEIPLDGYEQYWNSAQRKGYSGTAVFTRVAPQRVVYDIPGTPHVGEGRAITLEFSDFYLVNVYVPNAQKELARIDYRMAWEDDFRAYVRELDRGKPVVICGDMNVARTELDLKNPKTNRGNAGFSDQERGKMEELLEAGFADVFRELYPDRVAYTWWSYMFSARKNNAGWRIDYFLASQRLMERAEDFIIHDQIMGSDHCPVELNLRG
jgi:exodeoxyribonuclease-3